MIVDATSAPRGRAGVKTAAAAAAFMLLGGLLASVPSTGAAARPLGLPFAITLRPFAMRKRASAKRHRMLQDDVLSNMRCRRAVQYSAHPGFRHRNDDQHSHIFYNGIRTQR